MKFTDSELLIMGGVVVVIYLLWRAEKAAAAALSNIPTTIPAVVGDVGTFLGVPATDKQKCIAACQTGDSLGVATYCTVAEAWDWEINGIAPTP